jgi:Virus neck protein
MAVSTFFDFYKNRQEQSLVEDLANEAINIFGFNGYYIPRNSETISDLLYGDDPLKKFDNAFPLAMRLSNQIDPGMNTDFFSKFGLEIKNNVRIQFTKREFSRRIPRDTHSRPKEGDLIYIPHLSGTGELYEIKYTNDSVDKFALGRKYPYYWELELELFKYNNEDMNTGIGNIDVVANNDAYAVDYVMGTGSGNYKLQEIVYQGSNVEPTAYAKVQEWDSPTKTLKVTNMTGEFSSNSTIIGETSNASYVLLSFDLLDNDSQNMDGWDNKIIEIEAATVIDESEQNPFGSF